jgi:HSP20 family protein
MAVVRWEPFREVAALQGEMSRFMNQLWGGAGGGTGPSAWLPALDVWETDDELVLALDLPGVPEDKVSIEVEDSVLTVSGEREHVAENSGDRFFRFERRFGQFSRSVTLPQGVDETTLSAEYTDGVLEIHVPKPAERKPTRIPIGVKDVIEAESTSD